MLFNTRGFKDFHFCSIMSLEYHLIYSLQVHFIALLLFCTLVELSSQALVITNKMRYSNPINYNIDLQGLTSYISYKSYPSDLNELKKFKTLDKEDQRLLDKFYNRNHKTSKDKNLGIENVWKTKLFDKPTKPDDIESNTINKDDGSNRKLEISNYIDPDWQIDINLLKQATTGQIVNDPNEKQATYSPLLKILTSYDPLSEKQSNTLSDTPSINKIVGVTLGASSLDAQPNLNSTLAIDAIKLHDDMLKPAPKDGKTRVRMYFHQAIHDDVKLYGNGPWKYWGHGWGMELGYDPKNRTKNFFQRGYSIERAYGRDFCKDQTKCRKSDPTFFDNMLDAGKYTKDVHNQIDQD